MTIDERAFRDTLGRFPTGVTVVTAKDPAGGWHGVTVGSFASLSLDPPLVLFNLETSANCHGALREATHFTINILAEDQRDLSSLFASKDDRPWGDVEFEISATTGAPRLAGCVAYVDCECQTIHEGGDHDIFIGRVLELGVVTADGRPLLHFGGAYHRLDPELVE